MPRYIDANRLQQGIKLLCEDERNPLNITAIAYFALLELVDTMPTTDVQEVKHGHWINGNCGDYVCSVCGWAFSDELPYMARKYDAETEEIMRYCMHCGAKMDGGELG